MSGEIEIQIFTVGGTIDKVYFDVASEFYVGAPQIGIVLRTANVAPVHHVESLMRKDSLDMTEEDRCLIVERVRGCGMRRILITHGTDTMPLTALALDRVAKEQGKTVVLIGSMAPARFHETDAIFNIGFAFAAVQMAAPGAWIAMNGKVFAPDRVRKNRDESRFEELQGNGGN